MNYILRFRPLLILLAVLFLVAFTHADDPKQLIARTWRVSDQCVKPLVDYALRMTIQQSSDSDHSQLESQRSYLESVVKGSRITFLPDGTYQSATEGRDVFTGTWRLSEDRKVLLRTGLQESIADTILVLNAQELRLRRAGQPDVTYVPANQ